MENKAIANTGVSAEMGEQYSLARILGIWALAAVPMGILGWVVAPALSADLDPLAAATTRLWTLMVGLIWEIVLSMIIVRQEEGDLRWATVKRRLRLNTPRDPKTGETRRRLWLWVVPFIILFFLAAMFLAPILEPLWVSLFPFLAEPPSFDFGSILESPDIMARLVGNWGFIALFVLMSVVNIFGEEFLFRGALLPKMNGVFGKWDWVANGLLFTLYHMHQPWGWLSGLFEDMFLFAFPAKRFRSTWMAIIIHGAQSVFFLFIVLGLVLGLA